MASIGLFLIVISSGSVLAAAAWNKHYEEVLPLTCSAIVLILFLSGVAGNLLPGVILVCLLAAASYIAAGYVVVKKASKKNVLRNLFTPAFFVFALLSGIILYIIFGKLASKWDEFSHWMDIVKVMSILDTFGTNPKAYASFASYPPGMSLFQYFLQKLYQWTSSGTLSEWRAYFAYYILDVAFFLPFLKKLPFRNPLPAIAAALMIFLGPLPFNGDYYHIIYIEGHLSVLFGTGLAMVFLRSKNDFLETLYIGCSCALLVLAKDAGLLLAILVLGTYLFDLWCGTAGEESLTGNSSVKDKMRASGFMLCSVLVPYLLWNFRLELDHVNRQFSEPYDFGLLLRVFLGQDSSYRVQIWKDYFHEIAFRPVRLKLSFGVLFAALVFLAGLLAWLFVRDHIMTKRKAVLLVTVTALQFLIFIVGLAATYIIRFAESGLDLPSFERYLSIPYCGCWLFLVTLCMSLLGTKGHLKFVPYILAGMLLCVTSVMNFGIMAYLSRSFVAESAEIREAHAAMAERITEVVPDGADLCIISQGDEGIDSFIFRYEARPKHIIITENSIGGPIDAEDSAPLSLMTLTAEEWQQSLVKDIDYVALYRLDDSFYQAADIVFEDPADIEEQAIYKVDHDTGTLTKCAP